MLLLDGRQERQIRESKVKKSNYTFQGKMKHRKCPKALTSIYFFFKFFLIRK